VSQICKRTLKFFRGSSLKHWGPVASEVIWKWRIIGKMVGKAQSAAAWGPKGRSSVGTFLGRGWPAPSSPAMRSGERCKLPRWGPERRSGRLIVLLYYRCSWWLLLLHFEFILKYTQQIECKHYCMQYILSVVRLF